MNREDRMRNRLRMSLLLLGVGLLAGMAFGQSSADRELLELLEGRWEAPLKDGVQVERWWTEPTAPGLVGEGVELSPMGDTVFVEKLALRYHEGALTYFADVPHNDGVIAFPQRQTRLDGLNRVHEFFNPMHDFPRRIQYTVINHDSLHVRVDDGAFEEPKGFELRFGRVSNE